MNVNKKNYFVVDGQVVSIDNQVTAVKIGIIIFDDVNRNVAYIKIMKDNDELYSKFIKFVKTGFNVSFTGTIIGSKLRNAQPGSNQYYTTLSVLDFIVTDSTTK